jgi:hypothetical protein
MIPELQINGGIQTIPERKFFMGNVVCAQKTLNTGTSTIISINALMALVVASTVGRYRPTELRAGSLAFQACSLLFRSLTYPPALHPDLPIDDMMFGEIPIKLDDGLPYDVIEARNGEEKLGRLTGITG